MIKYRTQKNMKRYRSYFILLVAALVLVGNGCKDPEEYDPNEPLDPPPGAPNLIYPLADTNLCGGYSQIVFFDWNVVPGAEIYEIQIDTSLAFTTPASSEFHMLVQVHNPPAYIGLARYAETATYYAVIRAGSSSWSNFTVWSEPRRFFLRPEP